jgi:hypothetical protein
VPPVAELCAAGSAEATRGRALLVGVRRRGSGGPRSQGGALFDHYIRELPQGAGDLEQPPELGLGERGGEIDPALSDGPEEALDSKVVREATRVTLELAECAFADSVLTCPPPPSSTSPRRASEALSPARATSMASFG